MNPNAIAYIDIEEGFDYTGGSPNRLPNNSLDFHFLPLSEKNILEVEKGENYRIAFIYYPRVNSKQPKTNKGISDSITSIGDWKDVTSDLETIPLSENARDKIELGEVSSNENSEAFESSVSMDEMVANTGIEEDRLTDYSQFDHTTKKFMNIDIDYPGQAVVELPFSVEFIPTGESIDTRTAAVLDPGTEPFAEEKIDFAGFHFSSAFEHRAPYNGEYAFYSSEYPEEKYYVDLVFHSYDNNYGGMPVPIIFEDFDEEAGEMTIWWKWMQIKNGEFVLLNKESVEFLIREAYIPLLGELISRDALLENGTVSFDVDLYPSLVEDYQVNDHWSIGLQYWDYSDNKYSFLWGGFN